MFVSPFYKQTDRCTMDRPLSAIFSAICMTKAEREDVHKSKPKIKNIFLNDIINRRRKYLLDMLNMINHLKRITITTLT